MSSSNSAVIKGAKFYKVDLHVHTSASLDYKEQNVNAELIIRTVLEKKIDLIAITDHNTVSGYKSIVEKANGTGIVVLPGVEITVAAGTQGIHILAIFDRNTPEQSISDMLVRIGIDSNKQGKQEALSTVTIPEVFNEIVKAGGIAIAAHIQTNRMDLPTIVEGIKELLLSMTLICQQWSFATKKHQSISMEMTQLIKENYLVFNPQMHMP